MHAALANVAQFPDRARRLKVDLVVHGRFYAFDLARELIRLGHDVLVYTNYPKFAAARFGLPPESVRSFLRHGFLTRLHRRIDPLSRVLDLEPYFHQSFGSWAAGQTRYEADVVCCFSGVAEEILHLSRDRYPGARWLVRASAHIRRQQELLRQEEMRVGSPINKPSAWMLAREEREYALADKIVVLSTFARSSFIEEGVGADRLILLRTGVESRRFRASSGTIAERCARIASGQPLNVLTVGSFTARKGGVDLLRIAAALAPGIKFQFVGDVSGELGTLRRAQTQCGIEFHSRVLQPELAKIYESADIFVFPTIEDGAPAVLDQAAAAGLPILTTTNCSGQDLVRENVTGWVFPIRNPEAFISRIRWCDRHRQELTTMVRKAYELFEPRDWNDMALDFVQAARNSGWR